MAVRSLALPPTFPRLDRRYVIAGILAALAATLVLVLTQPGDKTPVLVAATDLPSGHVLTSSDVDVRLVADPTGLVVGDAIGDLAGYALAVPLDDGQLLLAPILVPPRMLEHPQSLSLSIPVERAVLGRLAAGDTVDVFLTTAGVLDGGATVRIARDVFVIDVERLESPGGRDELRILFAVDDELAATLAGASHAGSLDIVRRAP